MKVYGIILIILFIPLIIFSSGQLFNETRADKDPNSEMQQEAERQSKEEQGELPEQEKQQDADSEEEQESNGESQDDLVEQGNETDGSSSDEIDEAIDDTAVSNPGPLGQNERGPGWLISRWNSTGGPYSGEIISLTQDPHNPSHMYAGTPHGLFKSFDKGHNWYDLGVTNSRINDIAVSKVDSNLVFLGTEQGLYFSRDGGAQWGYHSGALEDREIYFVTTQTDPIFNETTLVGTDQGVYVSRTNGRSFTQIGFDDQRVTAGTIHESAPEELYLAVENEGLVVSKNRGNTWESISEDFVGEVLTISFNPSFPYIMYLGTTNGIYASYDSGLSWEHEGVLGTPVYDIWMDPDLPIHLVAATEGQGIKRSTNAGDDWSTVSEDLQDVDLLNMITDYEDKSKFYFGTGSKGIISMSIDDADYTVLNEGLTTYIHELHASAFDPDALTAVSDDRVYYTEDRGNNWTELLDKRPLATTSWQNPDYTAQDTDYEQEINEQDVQEQFYMAVEDELLITTPGSGEITSVSLDQLDRRIYKLEVHPVNNEEIWVGTDQGVYVSRNGGETWNNVGMNDRFVEYLNVAYDLDHQTTVVYAGGYDGVFRYLEINENEESTAEDHPALTDDGDLIDAVSDLYGELEQFNEIISREDYALSELETVDFAPEQLWIGTLNQGLYYSDNAGTDFSARNNGLPDSGAEGQQQYLPAVRDLEINSDNADKLLLGLESGVYYSPNRGENWEKVNDLQMRTESFSAHFGPPTTMYLGTEEGVYRHEAYEIPHMGWEDEGFYTIENPNVYRFQEEFELTNTTNQTQEDVVFMAPKVLNHGTYQFRFNYRMDPEPVDTITQDDIEANDADSYEVEDSWFDMGNELLVFEKDELEPGETWEITAENELVVFEAYYDVEEMTPEPYDTNSQLYQQYTASDEVSQVHEDVIQERAAEIVGDAQGPISKAEKIFDWVKDYLDYVPPGNVGALDAYRSGEGVCADYSDLFVALARAEGIPARRLSGYYISGPDEGQYHAWAEFYLEGYGWIPVEPTFEAWYSDFFGELPDTSHIFMSYGIVKHEFTTGLEFDEHFSIEQVPLGEMGYRQEDILESLEEGMEIDGLFQEEEQDSEAGSEEDEEDDDTADNETDEHEAEEHEAEEQEIDEDEEEVEEQETEEHEENEEEDDDEEEHEEEEKEYDEEDEENDEEV